MHLPDSLGLLFFSFVFPPVSWNFNFGKPSFFLFIFIFIYRFHLSRFIKVRVKVRIEMYADQVEGAGKRSVKERLKGNSFHNSIPRRQTTGKSEDRTTDARDLRLKLQRESLQQVSQSGRGALSGVPDLREKLSGTMNPWPVNADPPKLKSDVTKPTRRSVAVETSEPEPQNAATTAAKKKAQQKADASVEGFLQSLVLEKYAITFQVEEVDMTALVHMTDDDLKALGIPMGPRKKIILALESRG